MAMYYAAKINGTWLYKLNGWPSVVNTSAAHIPAILLALGAGHTLVIDGGLTGVEYTDADYSTGGTALLFQAASQTIRGPVVGDPDFSTICGQPIFIGANHTTVYTNNKSGCIFERVTLKNSLTNGFGVDTNVTIRHCRLIDNETQLKVSLSGLVDVYGNTFEGGKDASSILFETGTPTINFYNNILKQSATKYAAGISIQGTGTYNIDNNQWVGTAHAAVSPFGTPASGIVNVRNNIMLACSAHPASTGVVISFSSGQTSTCTDNIVSVSAANPVDPIGTADTDTGNIIITPSDYAASGRHGYFCMSLDDASDVTWETLYGTDGTDGLMAIAEASGLRVTWCVDSSRAANMPANIRLAHSRGHEIGAHTRTHTDLNFTGKIFDVVKTSNTITINRTANTITLSGGGTVANFRSKSLATIKTELEGFGCTVTPVANYNTGAVNGISSGVYGEAIANATAVSQIDCYTGTSTEGYVWSEVDGSINELEAMIGGGYKIRSFAYPFGSGNGTVPGIMAEIKGGQILSSRRTSIDTASSQQLANFNPQSLASFNSLDAKANSTGGDTTEDIRANVSGLMAYLCETGAIVSTYAHGIIELNYEQWATIIDEAKKWAGKVSLMTNGDAMEAVIAETVDDGDGTRSKVWADGGNYHPQPTSPCIGAGVLIPAIHEAATPYTDFDGKVLYFTDSIDIGPYQTGSDTKTITSDYSPTGYGIREGATVTLGAHGLSVSFAGLTLNENNIRVKEAGIYRVHSFTRKAGTTQYVYGSNSGGSGGGIFGSNFG